MRFICILLSAICTCLVAAAQYAPQAGIAGSTAISVTSGQFTGWATHCTVQRGYMNIANPGGGYATLGDSSNATGPADGTLVSLGDSGVATLTFNPAIYNGNGPDFGVFENGFPNPADASQAFLELAFVEVSSDGVHFFRFPANSNTPVNTQVPAAGVYMDASLINNLAGKYISMYATPFDLQELAGTPGLDVNNITHVRLVDVVGSISGYSSQDVAGHIINDPYPTNIPSSGFDLDAVGAIHQLTSAVHNIANHVQVSIFPNPATDHIFIYMSEPIPGLEVVIAATTGNIISKVAVAGTDTQLSISGYPAGMYYLIFNDSNGNRWVENIVKY